MSTSKIIEEGLTYDDVLLIPSFSETLPREVSNRVSERQTPERRHRARGRAALTDGARRQRDDERHPRRGRHLPGLN